MTRLLALLCTAALAATPARAADTVAVVQSLTGAFSFIGTGVQDGLMLGLDEINAARPTAKLRVLSADDATDKGQGISLTTRYVQNPDVLFILGPTTGSVAGPAAQVANQAKVPLLTVTNASIVLEAGPWSFITAQTGGVAIPAMAQFATGPLKLRKIALVELSDSETYITQRKVFQDGILAGGARVALASGVKLADTDYTALAVRLVDSGADGIFLSLPAASAANLIIQMRQAGLPPEVKILGMTGLSSPDFLKIGGEAVEGTYLVSDWVPGGSNESGHQFEAAFTKRYGHAPDNWAAIGYSMTQVFAAALRQAGPAPTRDSLQAALQQTRDVPVIIGEGTFSYDAERLPHYGNNIVTVRGGRFVPLPP